MGVGALSEGSLVVGQCLYCGLGDCSVHALVVVRLLYRLGHWCIDLHDFPVLFGSAALRRFYGGGITVEVQGCRVKTAFVCQQ